MLPEDQAFAGIATGFANQVKSTRRIYVEKYNGGKAGLLARVHEFLPSLSMYPGRHLVVLFDGDAQPLFDGLAYPADRVFCLSTKDEVEDFRREMLMRHLLKPNQLQEIGRVLADECRDGHYEAWNCDQLQSCADQLHAMRQALKPILFE